MSHILRDAISMAMAQETTAINLELAKTPIIFLLLVKIINGKTAKES